MESKNFPVKMINRHLYLYKEKILIIISFIIILLIILYIFNYYLFHSVAEIVSFSIAYAIFMFSINSHKITKFNFFIILGIGYMFVAIFDLLHTFTYNNLNNFLNEPYDIDIKFYIAARFIEVGTFLSASITLYNKKIKPNFHIIISFVYLIITIFLIMDILYLEILMPNLFIEGIGLTKAKVYIEYMVILGLFISLLLIYKSRDMSHAIFSFIILALILKILSEVFFTLYITPSDIFNIIGHLLKVSSTYLIYIGIVENGINKPFETLQRDLMKADSSNKENEIQRKYLEKIMIQNEECYDLIINNSNSCITIVKNYKIIYANTTAAKAVKINDVSDLIGRSVWDFIHTDLDKVELTGKIKENKNSSKFFDIDVKNFNGDKLKFEYSLNDIIYKGSRAYLVVLRNINHREKIKLLENDLSVSEEKLSQSEELNRGLTEFFCNISHEFKTPLNIILGSIHLILQNEEGQEPSLYLDNVNLLNISKQNAYRLVRLINNLIDISKCDAGYLNLNKHNYNIVSLVEDITLSVTNYFNMNDIKVIFDTNTEEKIMAVDSDSIERVMLNLLSNALKFTDKGGQVYVNLLDIGEFVRISVKDTGIGIPEEKLNVIFNRFEQVDKTFTRKREGSGIGLALVKSLIELHGGIIDINSKINEGTEFIIELPVIVLDYEEISQESTFASKVDRISIEFSDIYT